MFKLNEGEREFWLTKPDFAFESRDKLPHLMLSSEKTADFYPLLDLVLLQPSLLALRFMEEADEYDPSLRLYFEEKTDPMIVE